MRSLFHHSAGVQPNHVPIYEQPPKSKAAAMQSQAAACACLAAPCPAVFSAQHPASQESKVVARLDE